MSLASALHCGGARAEPAAVQDIVVSFDGPGDRSPLEGPSARRAAAGREVRTLLGHGLSIEIDAALSPEYKDSLDYALTHTFEELATALERLRKSDPAAFAAAQKRLGHIAIRYAPGTSSPRDRAVASFEGEDVVVVSRPTKSGELIPVAIVMALLDRNSESDRRAAFAKVAPENVPPSDHQEYIHWLQGWFEHGASDAERRNRTFEMIPLAVRFTKAVKGPANVALLDRHLIDSVLTELAWGRLGNDARARAASETVGHWLEQDFDRLPEESRARALDILLGRGTTDARLRETALALSVRVIDAWAGAGHPLPSDKNRIRRDFELVVCPHPKNDRDARSLGPNCEGGIVRLLLGDAAGSAGVDRLGSLLAERHDPVLVEHVMVSAGYSTYAGSERKLITLLRAVEADAPLLRTALRVMAEEHAQGATIDVWMAEIRRLWLARPAARGSLLYVLVHLDPYGHGKVDFDHFADDFGARVSAEEARSYFAEGYQALSMAPGVWPAFAPGFSRAQVLRPFLDRYLEDPLVPRFRMRDPYEALVQIRHRLCEEGAVDDLRALSSYFAERVKTHPGRGLDDMSKTYDPKTCEPRRRTLQR